MIDLNILPRIELSQKRNLPKCAAIYFVLDSEETVLYIGQTQNLVTRWRQHHRWNHISKIPKASIAWMKVEDLTELTKLERQFIKDFCPVLNKETIALTKPSTSSIDIDAIKERLKASIQNAKCIADAVMDVSILSIFDGSFTKRKKFSIQITSSNLAVLKEHANRNTVPVSEMCFLILHEWLDKHQNKLDRPPLLYPPRPSKKRLTFKTNINQITLSLPVYDYERLTGQAEIEGISKSEMARKVINLWLEQKSNCQE